MTADQNERVEHRACREAGCSTPAVFAIFAVGYPAAQAVTCERHLGNWLLRDMSNPGSTNEWIIRVGSWVR